MDTSAIASAIQSVYACIELVKTGLGAKEAAAIQRAQFDLMNRLSELVCELAKAKDAQADLQDALREAKARLARRKQFAAQKKRYRLQEIGPQTYAYVLKPEAAGEEPAHCCCPRCFDEEKRAILQKARDDHHLTWLKCPHCGAEYAIPRQDAPEPEVMARKPGRFDSF